MRSLVSWAILAVSVTFAAPAMAHHGIVNFDLNKDMSITGTLVKIDYVNPHSWIHVDVINEAGEVEHWRCETRSAAALNRSGWSPEMFAPGQEVTITGAPDRSLGHTCYMGTIIFADGSSYDRYEQIEGKPEAVVANRPARRPNGAPNFAGDWVGEQRVMTDPRGIEGAFLPMHIAKQYEPGEVPEGGYAFQGARGTWQSKADDPITAAWGRESPLKLTEAGKKALEGFDPASTDNPRLDCRPTNILFDWYFDADPNQILQTENTLVMRYGFMGLERTIHIGMEKHPENIEPSVAGHSIGHWEGDTLVVDTIGFKPGVLLADAATMHSDAMHTTEWFTLDPETVSLTRRYTAEDPKYWEDSYSGQDVMHVAEIPYTPASCDDQSFRTDVPVPEDVAEAEEAPAKRWWEFWK
jgi:hypothetical protein